MKYDYVCDECGSFVEVSHSMKEAGDCLIACKCGGIMRIRFTSPQLLFDKWGNRSSKRPDRPSNEEYRAYKEYERTMKKEDYMKVLRIKGEIE